MCQSVWRPSRLESECIHGEGVQFSFPDQGCSPFHDKALCELHQEKKLCVSSVQFSTVWQAHFEKRLTDSTVLSQFLFASFMSVQPGHTASVASTATSTLCFHHFVNDCVESVFHDRESGR